jgi:hypothetical protein
VCSYDRAGYGSSEPGPKPRTAERIAGELELLLRNARINGPIILCHSAGLAASGHDLPIHGRLHQVRSRRSTCHSGTPTPQARLCGGEQTYPSPLMNGGCVPILLI